MTFALDLLDTLAEEAPQMVLPVVRQAAESGEHLLVQRWIDDHINVTQGSSTAKQMGAQDPAFVKAMLTLSSFSDGMPLTSPGAQAARTFGQWAKSALVPQAGQPSLLAPLLRECVHSTRPSLESAGRELLSLGASAMVMARGDASAEPIGLAGVKMGLRERNETLLARALGWQHPLAPELIRHASSGKHPWPVVAEVEVDGQWHPVNAAGHCLATGDLKMLREVLAHTQGDEHARTQGLAQAIDFSLSSGLCNHCTSEVAQGIAMCIAAGADLDHARIGQRLTQTRVTLADEVSDVDANAAGTYAISALFMSVRTGPSALSAISRLVNNHQLPINGPVTESGNQASLLHYAAAAGHPDLVRGLIKLGANEAAQDSRGFCPKHWAQMLDRPLALALLDPQAPVLAGDLAQSAPKLAAPAAEAPMDDQPWDPEGGWIEESMDDAAEQALFSVSQVQTEEAKPEPPAAVAADRNKIAPAMTQAQASKGAALFARLKSSQADIASKSVTAAPVDPAASQTEDGKPRPMAFRR